jgi:phosphomethylpyrimidine synthase
MSQLRRKRDWEGQFSTCIDPAHARKIREKGTPQNADVCSMCAEFCVFKVADDSNNN